MAGPTLRGGFARGKRHAQPRRRRRRTLEVPYRSPPVPHPVRPAGKCSACVREQMWY